MMLIVTQPLVSIIVPTKNSAHTLAKCLESVSKQTYANIEIVVIDNYSQDETQKIAKLFTPIVISHGPERSAQVNFGASKARGEYVYKVDSDFILDSTVVEQCIIKAMQGFDAVVVHNSPDETISWIAKIRKFEVDMYKYDITHSSARFVRKEVYWEIDGFNEKITAGEDYDFQNKLNRSGFRTGFIEAEALHIGEPKKFLPHMKKYFSYGKDFVQYKSQNQDESKDQLKFGRAVYFANWKKFVTNPGKSFLFLGYNLSKYGFGAAGYAVGTIKNRVHVGSKA